MEEEARRARLAYGVKPVFKRVDTCAAEFQAATAYMYSTYEEECEAAPSDRPKIMVLGGRSVTASVKASSSTTAAFTPRSPCARTATRPIMVNCNPETVSTDYDISDRLYFEPVTLEDVLAIVEVEQPAGLIVQFGGQTPLKLVDRLHAAGVPIIGTSPDAIDRAEDRERFQSVIDKVGLRQPSNRTAVNVDDAVRAAEEIGYPIVVRPSYVLGGRAMEIVYNAAELTRYFAHAVDVSFDSPVLLDRFLEQAVEVDVDAVSDGDQVVIGAIMQHIEQAGVHSGDSACALPPFSLSPALQDEIRHQVKAMAVELGVVGLMNVQLAIQDNDVYVLEVNPRASRTVPFVSKCIGVSLAKVARALHGRHDPRRAGIHGGDRPGLHQRQGVGLPVSQVPGGGSHPRPRDEIHGRGDGCRGHLCRGVAKASLGAGDVLPKGGTAFVSVKPSDRPFVGEVGRALADLGFRIVATRGTARCLNEAGVACDIVNKVREGRPDITDRLRNDDIDLIVNSTEGRQAIADSAAIRRLALQHKVCYTTTLSGGIAFCTAIREGQSDKVRRLQTLHSALHATIETSTAS